MIKPLRELLGVEAFESYGENTSWYIKLKWVEPQRVDPDRPELGYAFDDLRPKKYDVVGPLNQRLIEWAERHYEYWFEKAHVPLKIEKIEYLPEYHGRVSW